MACRLAFFVALDVFDHLGLILRSAIYMVMYYSFAQPRAIIWQMYLVTYAIMYACTGMAYLLSQVTISSCAAQCLTCHIRPVFIWQSLMHDRVSLVELFQVMLWQLQLTCPCMSNSHSESSNSTCFGMVWIAFPSFLVYNHHA